MSDAEPASRADQLGVVDPLRIPGLDPARRILGGLPALAQVFLVAVLVDIVARTLGVLGLPPAIDFAAPLSIVGFLPHLAFVLLPVVVLWRRPDAAVETPLVLWGAAALALVELLSWPVTALFSTTTGDLTGRTVAQIAIVAVRTAGFVALARGLQRLTRAAPNDRLLGLSNLVFAVIAGSALLSTLFVFILPGADLGDPAWDAQVRLMNALASLPTLAFAFLARVVVRGTVDLQRPMVATSVATGAVVLSTLVHAVTLFLGFLALLQLGFALSSGPLGFEQSFVFGMLEVVAQVLLVIAFGLGLADTSVRMPRASQSEESPA